MSIRTKVYCDHCNQVISNEDVASNFSTMAIFGKGDQAGELYINIDINTGKGRAHICKSCAKSLAVYTLTQYTG